MSCAGRKLTIGLVGAGMFGGDACICAPSPSFNSMDSPPWLGRLGLDPMARVLGDIEIECVALATRTEKTGIAKRDEYRGAGAELRPLPR